MKSSAAAETIARRVSLACSSRTGDSYPRLAGAVTAAIPVRPIHPNPLTASRRAPMMDDIFTTPTVTRIGEKQEEGMRTMKVAIIGAGPTGLVMGIGLARRGHQVVAVDRDGGPAADGSWPRKGVMQFHHAHGFRPQIGNLLQREAPAAWQNWLA